MNSCEMKFTIFMLKFARNRILYFCEYHFIIYLQAKQYKNDMLVTFNEDYVEFTIEEKNGEPLVSICNVLELSNHYN